MEAVPVTGNAVVKPKPGGIWAKEIRDLKKEVDGLKRENDKLRERNRIANEEIIVQKRELYSMRKRASFMERRLRGYVDFVMVSLRESITLSESVSNPIKQAEAQKKLAYVLVLKYVRRGKEIIDELGTVGK